MGISYLNFTQIIQQAVGTFTSTRINNYISKQTIHLNLISLTTQGDQQSLTVFTIGKQTNNILSLTRKHYASNSTFTWINLKHIKITQT